MKEDLENLIHTDLTEFANSLCAPDTRIETNMIAIDEPNPKISTIIKTCDKNNLPYDSTWLIQEEDGECFICHDHSVNLSKDDKIKWVEGRFNSQHFSTIYAGMIDRGYKRVGFSSSLLAKFHGKSPYKMFINGEIEMLVEYYSLYFKKQEELTSIDCCSN